jgi:hypothetical protein
MSREEQFGGMRAGDAAMKHLFARLYRCQQRDNSDLLTD